MSRAEEHLEDERLRQALQAGCRSGDDGPQFQDRVIAKIHRRRLTANVLGVSAGLVVMVGACLISPLNPFHGRQLVQSDPSDQPQGQAADLDPTEDAAELDQLAVAFEELSSPVADLSPLEGETDAWMNYLTSLESNSKGK